MDSSAVGAAAARPTAAAPSASRRPRCCSTHSALTRPRRGWRRRQPRRRRPRRRRPARRWPRRRRRRRAWRPTDEAIADAVGSTEAAAAAAAAAAAVPWMQAIEHEMRLRAAVVRCERHGAKVLGARKGKARVARRAHRLAHRRAAGANCSTPSPPRPMLAPWSVESVVSVGPGLGAEATAEQDALIDALLARRGLPREEHTHTRVLLAERPRRRLARGVFGECEATSPADESPSRRPRRQLHATSQRAPSEDSGSGSIMTGPTESLLHAGGVGDAD